MCIRDSVEVERVLGVIQGFDPIGVGARTLSECLALQAKEAVSYTHLRAHETVLDLVCRLLLEKKKKQEQVRTSQNNNQLNTQTDPHDRVHQHIE